MKKYVEEFVIVDELGKYMISEEFINAVPSGRNTYVPWQPSGRNTYVPWQDGSAIHKGFNTIQESRQYIFSHAKENMLRRVVTMEKRIHTLTVAVTALGDDVFNLGKYKITD